MIPFPFNENRFSFFFFFFVADYLLVGQLCTNPKSNRSLLSCLKVTQCSTSEIGDEPLYNTCKLWQQDHCQHPQNANPDGSTLEGTAQHIGRPFGGGGAEGHRQENPDQGVHRKGPGNHWWNSSAVYSADCRRLTHNCECMCEGGLKCRSYRRQTSQILTEKTKNLRLIKSVWPPPPPTWTCWTTSFGHTSRTSPTWPPLIAAIHRVFAELTPALVEKTCPPVPDPYRGGDWGWRWLHWLDVSSTT